MRVSFTFCFHLSFFRAKKADQDRKCAFGSFSGKTYLRPPHGACRSDRFPVNKGIFVGFGYCFFSSSEKNPFNPLDKSAFGMYHNVRWIFVRIPISGRSSKQRGGTLHAENVTASSDAASIKPPCPKFSANAPPSRRSLTHIPHASPRRAIACS